MDHSPIRQSFEFGKSISKAGKSKHPNCNSQVWLKNIVKCGKHIPVMFANFVYYCITHAKVLPLRGNVVTFFPRNTKLYKTIFSTFFQLY